MHSILTFDCASLRLAGFDASQWESAEQPLNCEHTILLGPRQYPATIGKTDVRESQFGCARFVDIVLELYERRLLFTITIPVKHPDIAICSHGKAILDNLCRTLDIIRIGDTSELKGKRLNLIINRYGELSGFDQYTPSIETFRAGFARDQDVAEHTTPDNSSS